jgi:hypothetical protein
MNLPIAMAEVRLSLRLIAKQPILSATIILALATGAGRTLIPADGERGAERAALLRESLWRRRYSADPKVVGRLVTVGGQPRTIVGVMPDAFDFPGRAELWLPLDELTLGGMNEATRGVRMFGVLRPGVSFDGATTEMAALSAQLPIRNEPGHVARVLARSYMNEPGANLAMSAIVFVLVMVLLVIASNVATLVFARTWARAPELAARTALGAARSRVVSQLFLKRCCWDRSPPRLGRPPPP